jgi:cytochrome c nitrite reductase small subunit
MQISAIKGVLLGTTLGLAIGVVGFTFVYAKGASYLTSNPEACANCHIMQEQYDAWLKSTHRNVALCNDCHAPASLIPKYYTKAQNGFFHSLAFTTGRHPDPIHIKAFNLSITEQACRRCHANIVDQIEGPHGGQAAISCVRCHNQVGHPNKK